MYFSSHSSDKQYFSSQKIDENVVFLATAQDKSGLTRQELQCVVTRNETLSGYRNCITTSWLLCRIGVRSFMYPGFMISLPQSCSSLPSTQSSTASQRFFIGIQNALAQANWSELQACRVKLISYMVTPSSEHLTESLWTVHLCEPKIRELSAAFEVARKSTFLACRITHSRSFPSYLWHFENGEFMGRR